jgi:hypothetical protein
MERNIMDRSLDRNFKGRSLAALVAAVCAGLAGCANVLSYQAVPGEAEPVLLARLGPPSERAVRAEGGQRLVYTRGPMGRGTTMIELDAAGRVLRSYEALTADRMASIQPGMPVADVQARLGPPAQRSGLAMEGRQLWAWRFPTYECEWFMVTLSAANRVLDAGTGPDPRCDVDHD